MRLFNKLCSNGMTDLYGAAQDALPTHERDIVEMLGGTITPEEYADLLMKGEG